MFWPCHMACGTLVRQPGSNEHFPVEAQSPNLWTTREVLKYTKHWVHRAKFLWAPRRDLTLYSLWMKLLGSPSCLESFSDRHSCCKLNSFVRKGENVISIRTLGITAGLINLEDSHAFAEEGNVRKTLLPCPPPTDPTADACLAKWKAKQRSNSFHSSNIGIRKLQ